MVPVIGSELLHHIREPTRRIHGYSGNNPTRLRCPGSVIRAARRWLRPKTSFQMISHNKKAHEIIRGPVFIRKLYASVRAALPLRFDNGLGCYGYHCKGKRNRKRASGGGVRKVKHGFGLCHRARRSIGSWFPDRQVCLIQWSVTPPPDQQASAR
jgi:hypothetical protein